MPGLGDFARRALLRTLELVVESAAFARIVRLGASFPGPARVINFAYLKLGATDRAYAHALFSRLFRDGGDCARDCQWKVLFAGKTIRIPLNAGRFWLDWDTALSITGHDIEVKQTYERILASPSHRPEWFVDVGANYGTHSLLFLAHGVRTVTIEPNSSCHDYFRQMCGLNDLTPCLEHFALGAAHGEVELAYPRFDTWLGSTGAVGTAKPDEVRDIVVEKVAQRPLDDFGAKLGTARTLIKIDTEGNELEVLKGAEHTLRVNRPLILFESLPGAARAKVFDFFAARKYSVFALPWNPVGRDDMPLTVERGLVSPETNFIAVPSSPG